MTSENFVRDKVCELEEHVGILAHRVKNLEDKVDVFDTNKLDLLQKKKKNSVFEKFTFMRSDYCNNLKPNPTRTTGCSLQMVTRLLFSN